MLVALLVTGAGAWWWTHHAAASTGWQGYAEADYVKVGPVLQGKLTQVSVARGDRVTAGAALFAQDEIAEQAARDQAARQLAQAKAQLANLMAGAKQSEIDQAEANLADARATLGRVQLDLQRAEVLIRTGAVSVQSLDQLRAQDRSAEAKVEASEAAVALARAPMGREREIVAQAAAVEAAQSALDMAQWRLDQRHVVAPVSGRVADVMDRPGETVEAGSPIVSLLPPENIFVRFFVPETALASLHLGDQVAIACDGCRKNLAARVSFISPQAEYSPPVIYSETSRAKLVFLIEARSPPEQARQLNPGQPVEVHPQAQALAQ